MAKRNRRTAVEPPPATGAAPAFARSDWRTPALLAALAFLAYANGIGNSFVGDDKFQLLKNPIVSGPLDIARIFGSSVWSFLGLKGNYYRPLQFLVYSLIYQVAGMQASAFHFVMVALHALNTALLFWLVARLIDRRAAIAAAALFALHPIHTEAVDWIASLPDLMMSTFVLGGVLLYARQEGAPRPAQIAVHCALYLGALWSKEPGAVLPALYFAYGFFVLNRRFTELRRNIALYAAMAGVFALYLVMRVAALGGLAPAQRAYVHLGPVDFALNVVVMAGRYIGMLFLPVGLNYFHVFHPIHGITAGLAISALALVAVAAAFWFAPRPFVAYGIFWAAFCLAPALNLTGVGKNVFTERYLYLPSVGFCWILGWAWALLAGRQRDLARVLGALVLCACAAATFLRNRDWADTYTMLQLTVRQSPDAGLMHDALAAEYIDRENVDGALAEERLAVQYEPNMALLHKKLGYVLMAKDPRAAAEELGKAAELEPDVAANHYDAGMALEASGDVTRAVAEYRRAVALDPNSAQAKAALQRLGQ